MTLLEKKQYLGYSQPVNEKPGKAQNLKDNYDSFKDWRKEGAVGPIRDEGPYC